MYLGEATHIGLLEQEGNTIFSRFFVQEVRFHLPGEWGEIDPDDVLLENLTMQKSAFRFAMLWTRQTLLKVGDGNLRNIVILLSIRHCKLWQVLKCHLRSLGSPPLAREIPSECQSTSLLHPEKVCLTAKGCEPSLISTWSLADLCRIRRE
jgi:hypothetical protein